MKARLAKIYNQHVIMSFFILLPLVEAITSITKVNYSFNFSFGVLYKTIFIFYCLIYLLFVNKKSNLKIITFLFITIYLILHGISVIEFSLETTTVYINNATRLISYIVSFLFFYEYAKSNDKINLNVLAYSGIIYASIILVAKLTNTAFATYSDNLAYGSSGWFYSGNEISSLFAIFIPANIYMLVTKQNIKYFIASLLVLYSSLVLGTKSSLVIVLITLVVLIITSIIGSIKKNVLMKRLLKWSLILTTIIVLILPYTESYKHSFKRLDETVNTEEIQTDNVIDFLYNGRQNFLAKQKELYKNSSLYEKIFGLKYENILKYENEIKLVELDYYDIVINYGIAGFLVWHYIIIYSLISVIKTMINNKKTSLQLLMLIFINVILVVIANIAGHVLLCSTVAICFSYCLALLSINLQDKSELSFREKHYMKERTNKKKMLICTPRISVGGMERAFINLLNMSEYTDNYEIWAYVGYIKDSEYLSCVPENINLHIVCNDKWKLVNKIKTVAKIVLDTVFVPKFDVAICYGHNNGFLSRLTLRASKNNIIFVHADLASRTAKELDKLNRLVKFEKYNKVVCVSNRAKDSYTKIFNNSDVRVINNYIDGESILNEANEDKFDKTYFNKNKITFISVARQEEKSKRLSRIIAAAQKLKKEKYNFQVLMLGDGPDTINYKEQVKQLDLENEIIFMGQKTNPYPYIKHSDVLLFSSLFEGYGIVLDEARLLDIPFISTDVADAKLIANEGFGITCDNSLEGIYIAMKEFLDKGYNINKKFDYIKFNSTITSRLNDLLEEN